MHDRPKHAELEDPYSTPLVHQNDRTGGTNSGQGESPPGNPSSGDDTDEAQANSDLLNTWMQQLQVLTVVTTFLASMDGEMFSLTALNTQIGLPISTTFRQLVYACLAGALIFHICATILGFIASFALFRYRIVEDITKVGGIQSSDLDAAQPAQRPSRRTVLEPVLPARWFLTFLRRADRLRFLSVPRPSRSSSPPPLSLLKHCYNTVLSLAAAGFALALIGILTYIWAGLPTPVGIFSTVCLGVGISAIMWAIAL